MRIIIIFLLGISIGFLLAVYSVPLLVEVSVIEDNKPWIWTEEAGKELRVIYNGSEIYRISGENLMYKRPLNIE